MRCQIKSYLFIIGFVVSGICFWAYRSPEIAFCGAVFCSSMIVIMYKDFTKFIVPDGAILAASLSGLTAKLMNANGLMLAELIAFPASMLMGLVAMKSGYKYLRKREGFGWGDVKLGTSLGFWLEPNLYNYTLLIASVSAIAYYFYFLRPLKKPYSPRVPFGSFWSAAALVVWVISEIDI